MVTVVGPRTHPVLYPRDETPKAVPKYISGRTSYLRVRLAFHRYPQLIRAVFNRHRCGPPAAVRRADAPPLIALFRLAFAAAAGLYPLAWRRSVTRRFILQKARRQAGLRHGPPTACRQPVSGSVSLPSRGAFHLSLTVLVHYRWQRVFSLRRWSSGIPPGLLVSRSTRGNSAKPPAFRLPGCHRLWPRFPAGSTKPAVSDFAGGLPPALPPPRPRCRNAGRLDTAVV